MTKINGVSFIGLLTLLFIALKLLGEISWPWLWVLSPIWGSTTLVISIVVLVLLGMLLYDLTYD